MQTSKKHYIAVSNRLKPYVQSANPDRAECAFDICLELAEIYTSDNALFDRERFFVACGFSPELVELNK